MQAPRLTLAGSSCSAEAALSPPHFLLPLHELRSLPGWIQSIFLLNFTLQSLLLFHPSHLLAADLPQVPPLQLQSFKDAAPKLVFFTKGFFIAQIEAQTLCCTYRSGDNVSVTPRLHILLFQEGFILLGKESNGSCQVSGICRVGREQ